MKNKSTTLTGNLTISRIPISKINPAPYNPRVTLRPKDVEYQQLHRSLETFGYVQPLVWNKQTGNLVGGHQRFNVLKAEGVKRFDVAVVDLDPEKEKVFNLALNKISGRWDQEGLAKLLEELSGEDAVDVALSGFKAEEIERIVKDGDQLVEMLIAKDEEEEEEEEGSGGGPHPSLLIIECRNKSQRKTLMKRLASEGFACRIR